MKNYHSFNEIATGKVQAAGKKKRDAPFSLRLSFAQKAALRKLAEDQPLGGFIRAVLNDVIDEQRPTPLRTAGDPEALGRVLCALGKLRLSPNVDQLARAVNTGTLPVTQKNEREITKACWAASEMRDALLRALRSGGGP